MVIAQKFSSPIVVDSGNPPDVNIDIAFDAAQAATFDFNGVACQEVFLGELNATFTTTVN